VSVYIRVFGLTGIGFRVLKSPGARMRERLFRGIDAHARFGWRWRIARVFSEVLAFAR